MPDRPSEPPPAFHANDQFADRNRFPDEGGSMGRAFSQQALCLGKLILHLLTGKKFYPVRVIVAQIPKKLLMGQIFTAKPHHQDGARIGMARQSRRSFLVWAWSWPVWLQPNGCGKA